MQALRADQKAYLPGVEWLVSQKDKDRGSGRTTVLSVALARSAIESPPGRRVPLFDHYPVAGDNYTIENTVLRYFPNMQVFRSGSGLSISCSDPSYPEDGRPPFFGDHQRSLMRDFRTMVAAIIDAGVDPRWALDELQNYIAESVMET